MIYSPDRLSRKYAYQVLLIEELARQGVEVIFIKAPQSETPEDQLLLQFQGMIAEYERAQILERSRRGKIHRAKQGQVGVLSGAPYGYKYVKKSDEMPAYYEVIEAEAEVVRRVFEFYTLSKLSIGEVTRRLNELGILTRKNKSQWERSTIWAMLRNPAYKGTACFGKTCKASRQRITRPLRLRGGVSTRNNANRELPREKWIEIPVPALVSETTFMMAQELLLQNKKHAPRKTLESSILQGLVCCRKCSYALSRTSTRTSARKISYYRCLGSEAWRYSGKALCDQKPVRQDLLDTIVWSEIIKLLEDPSLIQSELDRRLETARNSSSTKRRQDTLTLELTRVQKSMERLLTAYQEGLLSLNELRSRLPSLRQREQSVQGELQSINAQSADRETYLKLAESLSAFLGRLRMSAESLGILERQKIVRLLVREVVVDNNSITICHSIPSHHLANGNNNTSSDASPSLKEPHLNSNYLLRSGSTISFALQPCFR